MSEYSDAWDSLDQPLARAVDLSPKGKDFALVQAHADSLQLTPEERYRVGWGQDATSEDWLKQKAEAIRKEIDGSSSIAILRHGSAAKARAAAGSDAAGASGAAGAGGANAPGAIASGEGRGDGEGSSGNSSSPGGGATGNVGGTHSGQNSIGNNGLGSTLGNIGGSMLGTAVAGPLGGRALGALGGILGGKAQAALASMGPVGVEAFGNTSLSNGGLGTPGAPAEGPGTIGSRDTHGANETGPGSAANTDPGSIDAVNGLDAQSDAAAAAAAAAGGTDNGIGGGPDSSTDASSAGATNGSDSQSDNAGRAKGGPVTKGILRGPNPTGPDDGYVALDVGEYVIRTSSVKHYGADVMAALNARRIPLAAVRNLLNLQE